MSAILGGTSIYIAGKMTGLPDLGAEKFNAAAERLKSGGYIVLNPASLPAGLSPNVYMPICIAMIEAADCVYALNNWHDSPGAKLEILYATYQHKKVLYEPDEEETI